MPIKAAASKQGDGPPEFDEGTYALVITDIEDEPDAEYMGTPRPQIKWKFSSEDGRLKMTAWTSTSWFEGNGKLSPSKLYTWCTRLGIEAYQEAETGDVIVPVEQAVGKHVVAFVVKGKNDWPKVERIIRVIEDREKEATSAADAARTALAEGFPGTTEG